MIARPRHPAAPSHPRERAASARASGHSSDSVPASSATVSASPACSRPRARTAWARTRPSGSLAAARSGASAASRPAGPNRPSAMAAFHAQTATGKLNAEMMPTGPSGCHCSIMRWFGRSVAMVSP